MLEDVQARRDTRGIALDRVGVSGVRRPVVVWDRSLAKQQTVATIALSVSLSPAEKGAHLSRFLEALDAHDDELTVATIPRLLKDVRCRLEADRAHIDVAFVYFRDRSAPVTGARGLIDYRCRFIADADEDDFEFALEVEVPVTSLCPCSRAVSDYGAHNQRGRVTMRVGTVASTDDPAVIWIEELGDVAEASASSPLYPVLKRPDERYVTMAAYDNPVFVEDMARGVAERLQADERVAWFTVHVINDESIHNHDAFAELSWSRSAADG